jgi:hypothetical protein
MSSNRDHMFIFLIANIEKIVISFHMWWFGTPIVVVVEALWMAKSFEYKCKDT